MGNGANLRYQLEALNKQNGVDMQLVDGFDEAIIGYTDSWNGAPNGKKEFKVGRPCRAVYDRAKCISILEDADEISRDEAELHFESEIVWNLFNHWQNGPVFVEVFKRENLSVSEEQDLRSQLDEINERIADQICVIGYFDEAIIGYTNSFMGMDPDLDAPDDQDWTNSRPVRVVYNRYRCIQTFAKRNSLDRKKAAEKFEKEIESKYMGEHTPIFVCVLKKAKLPKTRSEDISKSTKVGNKENNRVCSEVANINKRELIPIRCQECGSLMFFHSTWGCGASVECPLCGWADVISPGEPNYPKEAVLKYGVDCGECAKKGECSLNIREC